MDTHHLEDQMVCVLHNYYESRGSVSIEVPSNFDVSLLRFECFHIDRPQISIQIKVSTTPTIHVHLSQLNGFPLTFDPLPVSTSMFANCANFIDISASKSLQSELTIKANQSESFAPSRP